MKKIIAILLLCALIVPFWGIYSLFHIHLEITTQHVSSEIEVAKRNNQLTKLSFTIPQSKTQLRWVKPHEFEYKGRMYDIVESGRSGNKIWYLCYFHKKETQIRKQIEKLVSAMMNQLPKKNDKTVNLIDFFKTLYFCNDLWHPPLKRMIHSLNTAFIKKLIDCEISPLVPPPKQSLPI